MKIQENRYTIIPHEISYASYLCGPYQGCRLKPSERVLLAKIVYNYQFGQTDERNDVLAQYIGVTLRQVKSILKKLVDGGLIIIKGKTAKRNIYPTDYVWGIWSNCLESGRESDCPNLGKENALLREDFRKSTNIKKYKRENINDNKGKVSPTLTEVISYVKEKNFTFSAENFFNYYESKNHPWTDSGGNPLRDWRITAAKWEKNQKKKMDSSWSIRKSVTAADEIQERKIEDEARRSAGFIW